jgi:predicted nucleotidyltransferase component of viral defense system
MKDYLLELVSSKDGFNPKFNAMREYLQAYILRILYDNKFFLTSVFLGGTALRFLYNLPRFSQDLDFSLIKKGAFSCEKTIGAVEKELLLSNYDVSTKYKTLGAVHYAMFKFKRLMYEAKLSPLRDENFSIKIEIDTSPPRGGKTENKVVNKYFLISFLTYDLPSLFAGKIHALLSREYTKGRDFFDLGWYLSAWKNLTPNKVLLTNALKQTGLAKRFPNAGHWKDYVSAVVKDTDWNVVKKDVESFLEDPGDINILNKENLLGLIRQ